MNNIIEIKNVSRTYKRGSEEIRALNGVDLAIQEGDFVAFTGPSGSGKTTLFNIIGCLDNPSSGEILLSANGSVSDLSKLSEEGLVKIRRVYFGFIFQQFFLIPTLTVRENIWLPSIFAHRIIPREKVDELLGTVNLKGRSEHLPSELSGGEQQRCCIARALINNPKILLADEPTGNLDTANGSMIFDMFRELNKKGLTILVVTHNEEFAGMAKRIVRLRDGKIV